MVVGLTDTLASDGTDVGGAMAGAAAAAFLKFSLDPAVARNGAFALLPPEERLGNAMWDAMSTSGFFGGPAEGAIDLQELLRGGSRGRDMPDAGVYAIAVFIVIIVFRLSVQTAG